MSSVRRRSAAIGLTLALLFLQPSRSGATEVDVLPADERAITIAAFRYVLRDVGAVFRLREGTPPPTVWCLAVRGSDDPPAAVLKSLADLGLHLEPLSICERNDLLYQEPLVVGPPCNLIVLSPWVWVSKDEATADAQGYGGSGRVVAKRGKKGFSVRGIGGWVG